MKNKKLIAAGLAMIMSVGLLAGCGGSSSSAGSQESAGGSAAATVSDGKTHIEFFNQKTEIVDILNGLISEYEAANPDIKIDLVTPSDASTVLATRMASNDTPDIFTNWPTTSFFEMVDSGYVMDLTDTEIMENVQDVARDQWRYNDKEYAATISYNCSGIWVNEDLLSANGITQKPATWAELIADCEKLQAAGVTPFVTSAKETSITDRQLQVFLASSMGANYDAFETDAGNAAVDITKPYAEGLKSMGSKMVQIVGFSQQDTMGTDQDSATANFANGQGAFMIGGSWLLASITSANPNMNISMMPIPGDTVEETNTCAYPGDMTLCIGADTEVKDAAVAFVKWMTSPEIANKYAEAEGNPSCIKGVEYTAPQFEELYANYVTTGKFILNPDCSWTSAQQDASGAAVQQLYHDLDAEAFPENLAYAFNDN